MIPDKMLIRAECNFLQKLLYEIFSGKKEFTLTDWKEISERIQVIRDQVKE